MKQPRSLEDIDEAIDHNLSHKDIPETDDPLSPDLSDTTLPVGQAHSGAAEKEPTPTLDKNELTYVKNHEVEGVDPEDLQDVAPEISNPKSTPAEHNLDDLAALNDPTVQETADDLETPTHIPHLNNMHTIQAASNSTPPQKPFNVNSSFNNQFSYHGHKQNKVKKIHLLILLVLGAAVIGSTVYLLQYSAYFSAPTATPSPSPAPSTPMPTPIPTPLFDRSKFKIRVLNGTTKTGLAASISAKLKGLGYQLDKTGNAPLQNLRQTTVKVKEGSSSAALLDNLTRDIQPDFEASPSEALKVSDSVDGEVVLGTK